MSRLALAAGRVAAQRAAAAARPVGGRARPARGRGVRPGRRPGRRREWGGLLFVLPYVAAFAAFAGFPIGYGFYISLHHWNGIVGDQGFVGLSQYTQLFRANTLPAHDFWAAMRNTLIFVAISVPALWAIPAVLAYLIYLAPAPGFFRSVYFFPTVFSATAVGSLWTVLFATQGGAVNGFFHVNVAWLTSQPWAWIALDAATVWWTLGFNLVIMYAGLTQLPGATFEAAAIDGAGKIRAFFKIALPQLRSVSLVVIVIATIASFNLFAQPYLMTGGGPGSSTTTLTMDIYNQAFSLLHMGSGTAMAFIMGAILALVVSVEYVFGARRWRQ